MLDRILINASETVRRTALYLQEHHAGAIERQEVAELVGISPDYLSRMFRQETGMSPWQYLNRLRIAHAQELLLSTTDSVTEIGSQVGFSDAAYFSRKFRIETGLSPQAFRKKSI